MSRQPQLGYYRKLVHYTRKADGELDNRKREADYSNMDQCGGRAMAYEERRLKTFKLFKLLEHVNPQEWARAGFFLCVDQTLQCAFCRGKLRQQCENDAMKEHRRQFSTCPFVLNLQCGNIPIPSAGKKPKSYTPRQDAKLIPLPFKEIKFNRCKQRITSFEASPLSKSRIRALAGDGFYVSGHNKFQCFKCGSSDDAHHTQCPYMLRKQYNQNPSVCSLYAKCPSLSDIEILTRQDSWAAMKAIEAGMEPCLVHYVIAQEPYFNGMNYQMLPFIIESAVRLKQRLEEELHVTTISDNTVELWKDYVYETKMNLVKNNEKKFNQLCKDIFARDAIVQMFDNTLKPNSSDYHKRLNDVMKDHVQCKLCYSADATILFKPCHHIFSCLSCTAKITKCPLCRTDINAFIEIQSF